MSTIPVSNINFISISTPIFSDWAMILFVLNISHQDDPDNCLKEENCNDGNGMQHMAHTATTRNKTKQNEKNANHIKIKDLFNPRIQYLYLLLISVGISYCWNWGCVSRQCHYYKFADNTNVQNRMLVNL